MSTNSTPKTINDYSKPANECAADELNRRFRDPSTGAKANGKKNNQTDGRFTKRGAFVKLGTKKLVELADVAEVVEVDIAADVSVIVLGDDGTVQVDGESFVFTFENDVPVLVAV